MAGAAVIFSGCIRSSFTQTDGQFAPAVSNVMPSFYLDRLPPQSYRSVGIIEVIASAGTDLSAVMRAAIEKGQELGCQVVVDRSTKCARESRCRVGTSRSGSTRPALIVGTPRRGEAAHPT